MQTRNRGRWSAAYRLRAAVCGAALAWILSGLSHTVAAAEPNAMPAALTEREAQITPEVRAQLFQVAELLRNGNTGEALILVEGLRAHVEVRALNYWESFEVYQLLGVIHRRQQDYPKALAALEECLKFTDIDSYRRGMVLEQAGQLYHQMRQADQALDMYEELSRIRGAYAQNALMDMAAVYSGLLSDWPSAIHYIETAIALDGASPKRSRYQALRVAYVQNQELEKALELAKEIVARWNDASDAAEMDKIISAMNARLDQ